MDTSPAETPFADGVDAAFGALGNETRLKVLFTLAGADEPMGFSALKAAVGVDDSGRFNYHLGKLDGQFVERAEEGYRIRQAGRRVVEAVYSGLLAEDRTGERFPIEEPCLLCGAEAEIELQPDNLEIYCTECAGFFGGSMASGHLTLVDRGYIGRLAIPPAGLEGRSPDEIYAAARVWTNLEMLSIANDVCPRCSARLEHEAIVCDDHEYGEGLCSTCGNLHPAVLETACTNGIFTAVGDLGVLLFADPAFQAFVVDHGVSLVAHQGTHFPISDLHVEVVEHEPLLVRYTIELEGDSIVFEIDDDLEVHRPPAS